MFRDVLSLKPNSFAYGHVTEFGAITLPDCTELIMECCEWHLTFVDP